MGDMNALDRKFMNAAKSSKAARYLGVASAAALLSACVGDPIASAKVDPSSPIAAEVAKISSSDKDYPRFSEIPPAPKDLRPPRIYGQRANELVNQGAQLEAATAPNTWTLGNTAGFAAGARRAAGPELAPPAAADTEAFAAAIRKRATPPPPANK